MALGDPRTGVLIPYRPAAGAEAHASLPNLWVSPITGHAFLARSATNPWGLDPLIDLDAVAEAADNALSDSLMLMGG